MRIKSKRQWQNQIRLIAVAEISKSFRKAGIIQRIIDNVKSEGRIATGRLASPERSNSIIPNRDDLFLTRNDKKKAISVRVYGIDNTTNLPSSVRVVTNVEYGVDERYYRLTTSSPDGGFNVAEEGIERIQEWIRLRHSDIGFTTPKSASGKSGGELLDVNDDVQVQRLSFAISNSIRKRGIKTRTDFDSPFSDVKKTLEAARLSFEERMSQLLETNAWEVMTNLFL